MITFGRKLKHLRQKNHLTQKEVLSTNHCQLTLTLAIRGILPPLTIVLLRLSIVLHDGLAAPGENGKVAYNNNQVSRSTITTTD